MTDAVAMIRHALTLSVLMATFIVRYAWVIFRDRVLERPIADFSVAYGMSLQVPPPSPAYLAGFLAGATLLGALAAWIAASRQLWARRVRRD